MSWLITEERTDYSSMSDSDFKNAISQLEAQITDLQSQIDALSPQMKIHPFSPQKWHLFSLNIKSLCYVLVTLSMT